MSFFIPKSNITPEIEDFYKSLTVKKDSYFNTDDAKDGNSDYYLYMENETGVSLPLGQWNEIYTNFPNQVKYKPNLKLKSLKKPLIDEKKDQLSVMDEAKKFLDEKGTVFLNLPTAYGKTSIGNMLIGNYKLKTLVICAKVKVLSQWVEEFEIWSNAKVQMLESKEKIDPDADVYVCSPHNLHKRISELKFVPMIIYDEMHLSTIKVYSLFLRMRPRYLIGLTATMQRSDGFDKAEKFFFGGCTIKRKVPKPDTRVHIIPTGISIDVKTRFFKGKKTTDSVAMASNLAVHPQRNKFLGDFIMNQLIRGFPLNPSQKETSDWEGTWLETLGEKLVMKMILTNKKIRSEGVVYPKEEDTFNIFNMISPENVRVLILGMDPYINPNQAHGVAFSIKDPNAITPPTIKNIFKELKSDVGTERKSLDLSDWVEQGVMLLNVALTVNSSESGSHLKIWSPISREIMEKLNLLENLKVVVLWGNDAQKYENLFPSKEIIKSAHPSPLSANRGFFGSKPFSQINSFLDKSINW